MTKNKNCIITGGTSGLGLNLVKKFINEGFFVHVIAKDNMKIKIADCEPDLIKSN